MTSPTSSQFIPILLNLAAAILSAFGQYFYKLGSAKLGITPIYKNYHIASGIFIFTLVMVLFLASFKLGGRLSVTYPVYMTTMVWGVLIGVYLGKEPWGWGQSAGALFVLVGVSMICIFTNN